MICQILQKYCRVEMLLTIWSTCVMFVFHKLASAFLSLMRAREELISYPGHVLFQKVEEDHDKVPYAGSLLRYPWTIIQRQENGVLSYTEKTEGRKIQCKAHSIPWNHGCSPSNTRFWRKYWGMSNLAVCTFAHQKRNDGHHKIP